MPPRIPIEDDRVPERDSRAPPERDPFLQFHLERVPDNRQTRLGFNDTLIANTLLSIETEADPSKVYVYTYAGNFQNIKRLYYCSTCAANQGTGLAVVIMKVDGIEVWEGEGHAGQCLQDKGTVNERFDKLLNKLRATCALIRSQSGSISCPPSIGAP